VTHARSGVIIIGELRGTVQSMDTAVWIDGRMAGPDASLSVDDHGIITGDGAFETLLAVDQPRRTAFAVGRHLLRLHRSCEVLGIQITSTDEDLRDAVDACVTAAPTAGIVRITVTSGRGPLGSTRGDGPSSVIVIAGGPKPSYPPGAAVVVFPHPRNERGVMAGVKTSSYAENVVALRYAHQRGASEAIFANTRGQLCEGTGSNIFWTDGGRFHTPPLQSGCLAGVTRALLMEHLDCCEADLPIGALSEIPEAFLTSSTRIVQSIARVDDTDLRTVDGPLTKAAAEMLVDLIAADVDP
jgi:branched-chain amino acid aminotransferase